MSVPHPTRLCVFGVAAIAALELVGCTVGRGFRRPPVPVPPAWRAAETASTAWPSADWWQGFGSRELDDLIDQARRANDDIAAAAARVVQADAQTRIAGAALLPAIEADAAASRARQRSVNGTPQTVTLFYPSLNASYALDFFGRNRSLRTAARATAAASRYDRATVELTVMASVATRYFQALALRDRLHIANDNLANATRVLESVEFERTVGTATALDVAQQATVVANLSAAVPPLTQQFRQTVDALAILVGQLPQSLDIAQGSLTDISIPAVTPGLPAQLLARRPDVAEAEAELSAAHADILAARAAFFPSITLTAAGGYESTALSDLLTPAKRVFSLTAGLIEPIFQGGALSGQYSLSKGRYAELLAGYHKAVLGAFGNVEDALIATRQTSEQEERERQAADDAGRAFELSREQLQAGTINILTVLNTENILFAAQDALLQVKFAHLAALVELFEALGGGWRQSES